MFGEIDLKNGWGVSGKSRMTIENAALSNTNTGGDSHKTLKMGRVVWSRSTLINSLGDKQGTGPVDIDAHF